MKFAGLSHPWLCFGCICCWSLSAYTLEYWWFSYNTCNYWMYYMANGYSSLWRGIHVLFEYAFSLFVFGVNILIFVLCHMYLCSEKEGLYFIRGCSSRRGFHWSFDQSGYWDWPKVKSNQTGTTICSLNFANQCMLWLFLYWLTNTTVPSVLVSAFVGTAIAFCCFSGAALLARRREFLYLGGLLSSGVSMLLWLHFASSLFGGSTALFKFEVFVFPFQNFHGLEWKQ